MVGQDMFPNPILESIVEECGGLPLAIVTVAGCMRGVSDPIVWRNALNELRGYIRIIRDVEDKVFGCLRFSYDHLQQIDQDCFLYCALYPEDYEIQKEEIVGFWMEEELIDKMGTRKAMLDSGHSILKMLEEDCLLERVGEGIHVRMHDVVRHMALHITRKKILVKARMRLKELPNEEEWTEDLEKVSYMYNHISTIPQNMKSPKCQKLTTLLLSHNRLEEIPESFFEHTPNLKILDLSGNPIVNLPNSISNLEKLTALLLHRCFDLEKLPSFLKLQALKKLDLDSIKIYEIPPGLEMLINLRYLNPRFTKYLKETPNGLLLKLCCLQYLAIHPAQRREEEMRDLKKLEVFECCFPSVRELSTYAGQRFKDRFYNGLDKYLIIVSLVLIDPKTYFLMEYSKMVAFVRYAINAEEAIILPYDTKQLQVVYCTGIKSLNDNSGLKNETDLKECTIWGCAGVESIFLSKDCQLESTLESLKLQWLNNLKSIGEESSERTFSSLKEIYIFRCGKGKKLFSAKWVLHNFEKITVGNCNKVEEIIVSEEEEIETIKYTLPKLRKLELCGLPELKSICSKNGVLVCDSLEYIRIEVCIKLKRIPLYLSWLDLEKQEPCPPPSLKEICVYPNRWWESILEWDHPDAK